MQTLLESALRRSFLHDDPDAYEAGVRDAFALLAQQGIPVASAAPTSVRVDDRRRDVA